MKLSRLWQPRSPAFWMMVVLNVLSALFAWVLRTYPLLPMVAVVIAAFALINAWLGLRLTLALMRTPDDVEPTRTER